MKIDKEIFNNSDYREYFLSKMEKDKTLEKTLEQALETRKFEIELYWKRTTYFWAFIATSFAGYFVVIKSTEFKEMTIIVSMIGLLFSVGWYLANRGSKYWQKNWETHVDLLEDKLIGPLYGTVLNPASIKLNKITGEYPFSVSKINQILSFSIVLIWIYILSYSFDYVFDIVQNVTVEKYINMASFFGIFIWTIILLYKNAETGLFKETKKANDEDQAKLVARKK